MSESHYPSNGPPALSDDRRAEHRRRYRLARRKQAEAAGETSAVVKEAKNDGMDVWALKAADAAQDRDPEVIKAELVEFAHNLALHNIDVGLPTPTISLSDEAWQRQQLHGAEMEGYKYGQTGAPASSNPCPVDTDLHAAWLRGHINGTAYSRRIAGPTVKTADATPRRKLKSANGTAERGNGSEASREVDDAIAAAVAADAAEDVDAPLTKRRGRPPGSKNRAKADHQVAV